MASSNNVDREAKAEWVGVLLQLWDVIGKTPNERQLMVYVNELGVIPTKILKQVISNLLSIRIYHTIPTIGEVWTELRRWYSIETGYLMGNDPISVSDIRRLKDYCRSLQQPVGNKNAEVDHV